MTRFPSRSAVAALLLAAFPVSAQESVSERAQMKSTGTLDVTTVAGEVRIIGWDRDEVEVSGEIGARQKLEFSAEGERTVVKVRPGHDDEDEDHADLVIHTPHASRVYGSGVSTSLSVEDVRGELHLQSVSGDIDAQIFDAEVDIATISGTVDLEGREQATSLRLSVVSGDVWARGIAGDLTVHTVSGDVGLEAGKLSRVRIDTTSGDLDLQATLDAGARVDIDSTSGEIRLRQCGRLDAEYELSSFSGDIRAHGRRGEATSRYGPTSELRFKEGSASGRVRIDTLSGDILLDGC